MAYKRAVRLEYEGQVLVDDDGSGDGSTSLDIQFLCRQATIQSSAQGEIRLWNVTTGTAHGIPAQGGVVTLSAGYADEGVSVIYKGELRQRRIGRESTTQTTLDLFCAGGDNAYNFATVSKTLAAGSTPMDHVKAAADAMSQYGVGVGYITQQLLASPRFPRAVSFHYNARDVLRDVARACGCQWFIADQKLYVVGRDEAVPGGGVTFNSQTGLVGQPTETPNGIDVRTLLTGRVGVGTVITIDQATIQRTQLDQSYAGQGSQATNAVTNLGTADGTYKVLLLERQGHLRGQEWWNNMTTIGSKTGVAPAGLTQQVGGDASLTNFSGAGS